MNQSIKTKILNFLTEHPGWQYGGVIEDFIRTTDGHKASNASRRCRELEDAGKIESQYVHVPGTANRVVQYRIKSTYRESLVPERVRIWQEQFKKPEPVKAEPVKQVNTLF